VSPRRRRWDSGGRKLTDGQHLAVEQLSSVEAAGGGVIRIQEISHAPDSAWVRAEVLVSCSHHQTVPQGVPLQDVEPFTIHIPADFPFERPWVSTPHTRFAGYVHVPWQRWPCLYQAPAVEWDPSDGMYGFLARLESWLDHAARGELDPHGMPLHPPITYPIAGAPRRAVVIRADTPVVRGEPWTGFAEVKEVSETRVDIVGWSGWDAETIPEVPAAAFLLADALPPEFPSTVRSLLDHLAERGISLRRQLVMLKLAATLNKAEQPFYVIVGAPMRGIRGSSDLRQHLAVWAIDPGVADALRLALRADLLGGEKGKEISTEVEQLILKWADEARVDWCNVMEDRPEIVIRRDEATPTRWFAEKTVALWGAGALGGVVAEWLARSGIKKLVIRDHRAVTPGLLVRQIYEDRDIGRAKAYALADRLKRIRPDLQVDAEVANIIDKPLNSADWTDGADIVIDTTASEAVASKLEFVRWTSEVSPVPIAAMAIGHRADSGILTVAPAGYTGGLADVARRAKLEALIRPNAIHYADEFWPRTRHPIFQPEPGCSEPTFVGGAADIAALAAMMLNTLAVKLRNNGSTEASATFVALPTAAEGSQPITFQWQPDVISDDPFSGYQVRVTQAAWREIVAWVERSRRVAGPRIETGGLLFGERDEALRIVWVTDASGPPADSEASEDGFVCGVSGVPELNAEKRRRSRDSVTAVGMWHAHPTGAPLPSSTDAKAMAAILDQATSRAARSLLMIVGRTVAPPLLLGTFEFTRADVDLMSTGTFRRECTMRSVSPQQQKRNVGLALSGGGARAMAFHLGCLRALHDRGILEQVRVTSSVSGGSVIGAMYAYSNDSFDDFDQRVVDVLRRGLVRGIARAACSPAFLRQALATAVTSGAIAKGAAVARLGVGIVGRAFRLDHRRMQRALTALQSPMRRRVSRTNAFEAALRDIYGNRTILEGRRGGMEVVINACELRTGSAFRFGSRESGCWRFGKLRDNDVPLALAVAASAAYPVLLPALDRNFVFVGSKGEEQRARVLLTDGGIFDNLGVTPMEPGRSSDVSSNVYSPDFIVACDAGAGLLNEDPVPYWWPSRMVRAFETVFRKVQNGAYQRLHGYVAAGQLRGFVLSYLGQQDDRLPHRPTDLVPREHVVNYPTDFSAMRNEDIEMLARRGEVLTRLLIAEYCPEL
jgi:predicted acylesterase/phospholipase RssA